MAVKMYKTALLAAGELERATSQAQVALMEPPPRAASTFSPWAWCRARRPPRGWRHWARAWHLAAAAARGCAAS